MLIKTPYSTYILQLGGEITNGIIVNKEEIAENASRAKLLDKLTKENLELKHKLKDLETTCALIRIEDEWFELKHDSLKKDIIYLDDK